MKTPPSRFATVAAFLGVSLCASETFSTEESTPFDAATVLHATPPVFVETLADNMAPSVHTYTPQVHTPPPTVHAPTPPTVHPPTPPNTHDMMQRANVAQNAAVQMANTQFSFHTAGIAAYAATKLQRQVAEAHARAYMAALRRADAEESAFRESGSSERRLTTLKKHHRHKRRRHRPHPRYIAVDTVRDKRSSPNAKRVVMIWDTQSEALVGNNVYDVKSTPALGKLVSLDTYSAEYVGTGTAVPP